MKTSLKRRTGLLAVMALLLASALAPAGTLRVEKGRFVDASGGVVVLRGFNLSQKHKTPPFRANGDPQLFVKLKDAGVNVVRHQFNWEAYESAPGVYDETYLDHYVDVAQRAAASGIHVLVDIHQDAYSRWLLQGCGEGFPRWTIPAGYAQSTPDNGFKCWGWPVRVMLQRDTMESVFNAFYTPGFPARAHYLAVLDRITARLAGNPWIVGYDLLNEPVGDGKLLMGLYADAIATVRRRDPSAIAFVEPEMFTGTGLEDTRLPPPPFGNVAFAPHYYDPLVYGYAWLGTRYEPVGAKNRALAAGWGAAVLLGEFGAPPSPLTTPYIRMIYDDLDNHGDSATQWSYTPEWTPWALDGWNGEDLSVIDDKGNWRANFSVRPYAQRTAGTYGAFKVETGVGGSLRSVTYVWNHDPRRGSTQLFVPKNAFGNRRPWVFASSWGLSCHYDEIRQLLSCQSRASGAAKVTLW